MEKVKIFHTSDWHLGKKLFNQSREPEQKLFLDWFCTQIIENEVDILIISGDIFDVPSPPNSSQKLFYDFIYRLGKIKRLTIFIIGGNHDSKSFLQIPTNFFEDINCFVFTGLPEDDQIYQHYLTKGDIKIGFKFLPYFKNFELQNKLDENTEIEMYFKNYFNSWNEKEVDFKFLISHHNYGNYSLSGSEHAIFLSGIEHIPLEWVTSEFQYVALGHIHKRIELNSTPPVIYSGSPIPMRFSETINKSFTEIIISNNELETKINLIPTFREIKQLKLNEDNYIEALKNLEAKNEFDLPMFLEIMIKLKKPMSGLADKVKEILKDKNIELISLIPEFQNIDNSVQRESVNNFTILELFENYYQEKFDTDIVPEGIQEAFKDLLEDTRIENP